MLKFTVFVEIDSKAAHMTLPMLANKIEAAIEMDDDFKLVAVTEAQQQRPMDQQHVGLADMAPDWMCHCGNMPHTGGFDPCGEDGKKIEAVQGRWDGLYVCRECGRIYTMEGEVIGRKEK